MSMFPKMIEKVAPCKFGLAEITHRDVPEFAARMAAIRGERLSAGRFCYLSVGGELYMSDTDNERATNVDVVMKSHGRVLIAGLGIGMILHPILAKKEVTSVTVVEKHLDVIEVISPTLTDDRLTVIEGDIYTWKPPKGAPKFNVIYFDIWPSQSTDDLADMARLHQRGKAWLDHSDPRKWMNSWNRENLLWRKRSGR